MIKRLTLAQIGIETVTTKADTYMVSVDLAMVDGGKKNSDALDLIVNDIARYLAKNNASIECIKYKLEKEFNYCNLLKEEYHTAWVEIEITKKIRSIKRVVNSLEKAVNAIIQDPDYDNLDSSIEFKPENTAISTGFSTTADMIAKEVKKNTPVLDYGCGAGRNIKYLLDNTKAFVCGTDIPEQLQKEKKKHDVLRDRGSLIIASERLANEKFEVALNSHVLNVIESDHVKQFVLNDIYKKLKKGGKAYIEVRTKSDVEGAKTKEPHGDGWKIKKGSSFTYQEAITKEKMINLVTNAGFNIVNHIFNSNKHIVVVAK